MFVQAWDEIPQPVQEVLSPPWGKSFKSYIVSPTENSTDVVSGMLWDITRDERKILDAWEVTGKWYDTAVLKYQDETGNYVQIEVPMIKNQGKSQPVIGKYYKNFINSKPKMLAVARHLQKIMAGWWLFY